MGAKSESPFPKLGEFPCPWCGTTLGAHHEGARGDDDAPDIPRQCGLCLHCLNLYVIVNPTTARRPTHDEYMAVVFDLIVRAAL